MKLSFSTQTQKDLEVFAQEQKKLQAQEQTGKQTKTQEAGKAQGLKRTRGGQLRAALGKALPRMGRTRSAVVDRKQLESYLLKQGGLDKPGINSVLDDAGLRDKEMTLKLNKRTITRLAKRINEEQKTMKAAGRRALPKTAAAARASTNAGSPLGRRSVHAPKMPQRPAPDAPDAQKYQMQKDIEAASNTKAILKSKCTTSNTPTPPSNSLTGIAS